VIKAPEDIFHVITFDPEIGGQGRVAFLPPRFAG
jgi:hypothetical protein